MKGPPGEREVEQLRQLPEDVLEIGAQPTARWGPRRWWSWMRSHVRGAPAPRCCSGCLPSCSWARRDSPSVRAVMTTPDIADTRLQIRALDQRVQRDVEQGDAVDLNGSWRPTSR